MEGVANMDHFLPRDTELSQQVDVVAATTRTVLKWIKGEVVGFTKGNLNELVAGIS